jgi:hypothetical protein
MLAFTSKMPRVKAGHEFYAIYLHPIGQQEKEIKPS